jgi:riboflavin synthase
MFAGIIERVGMVMSVRRRGAGAAIRIRAAGPRLKLGESVAVDGACLTAVDPLRGSFGADLSAETLDRTTLGELAPGRAVNLELSLRVGDRLGGHFVLGHIDTTGEVVALSRSPGRARLVVRYPAGYDSIVVEKGSVAVNGVSLTVAANRRGQCEIALIPHTLSVTNLGRLVAGSRVNLEFDYLAKLVRKAASRSGRGRASK